MQERVCIVLVNYNGTTDTIECIKSIRNISYLNYKIIVVDNASEKKQCEELNQFCKTQNDVVVIALDENVGFAGGNNVGIKRAIKEDAEYVILLNNDTLVDKNFIEPLVKALKENENVGASVSKIYYESEREKIWYAGGSFNRKTARIEHIGYGKLDNEFEDNGNKNVTFATGCCLCISRRSIKKIGLLEEKYFLYEEDTDYGLRIINSGYIIKYVANSIIYHKVSSSTQKISGLITYYMVRNKLYIIDQFIEKRYRGLAKMYSLCIFFKRGMQGEMNIKYIFKGLKDYNKKIQGKKNEYK